MPVRKKFLRHALYTRHCYNLGIGLTNRIRPENMNINALLPGMDSISPRSASKYFLANPYATPTAQLRTSDDSGEIKPAGRRQRFLAVLIDSIILSAVLYFIFLLIIFILFDSQGENLVLSMEEFDQYMVSFYFDISSINLLNGVVYLIMIVPLVSWLIINGYFLAKTGQTIGKMILNIAIRDKDTLEVPSLSRIVLKRYLIFDAVQLINFPLYIIVDIIDVLSIFRQDKRMIHDLIANTIVVQVPK